MPVNISVTITDDKLPTLRQMIKRATGLASNDPALPTVKQYVEARVVDVVNQWVVDQTVINQEKRKRKIANAPQALLDQIDALPDPADTAPA